MYTVITVLTPIMFSVVLVTVCVNICCWYQLFIKSLYLLLFDFSVVLFLLLHTLLFLLCTWSVGLMDALVNRCFYFDVT